MSILRETRGRPSGLLASKWRFAWVVYDLLRREGHSIDRSVDVVIFMLDRTSNAYLDKNGELQLEWDSVGDSWSIYDKTDGGIYDADRGIDLPRDEPQISRGSVRNALARLDRDIKNKEWLAENNAAIWLTASHSWIAQLKDPQADKSEAFDWLKRLGWDHPLSPLRFDTMPRMSGPSNPQKT